MGRGARQRPERLAEKLRQIRLALGLSQTELLKRLEAEEMIEYNRVSDFEVGKSEPTLIILLRYARLAGLHVEDIIDDELDLPENLPGPVKYQGIKRAVRSRGKKR